MARNNTLPLDKRFPRQSTHFIEASQEMNPVCSSFSTPEVQACLSLGVAKFGTHWADKSSPSGAWVESNESVSHFAHGLTIYSRRLVGSTIKANTYGQAQAGPQINARSVRMALANDGAVRTDVCTSLNPKEMQQAYEII